MSAICMNGQASLDIILVEDDDFDAKDVRRTLSRAGIPINVRRFVDGVEAIEFLQSPERRYLQKFVILLDLNMPRMSGHEFLKAIREDVSLRRCVVVVMTTSSDERDIFAAYDLNVAGYLLKGRSDDGNEPVLSTLHRYWRQAELPTIAS